MYENNMYRKMLIIGIIFLLLLTTNPILLGRYSQEENQTSSITNITHHELPWPDLKIINVYQVNSWGWPACKVDIQNCGNKTIPAWTRIDVQMRMKKLFRNEQMCFYNGNFKPRYDLTPGRIEKGVYMGDFCAEKHVKRFIIARIYLEVDPNNKIFESNENNNEVWAYMWGRIYYSTWDPSDILANFHFGKLRQQFNSVDI